MEVFLDQEIHKGVVRLDFSKINECKGTIKVFVMPLKKGDTHLLN